MKNRPIPRCQNRAHHRFLPPARRCPPVLTKVPSRCPPRSPPSRTSGAGWIGRPIWGAGRRHRRDRRALLPRRRARRDRSRGAADAHQPGRPARADRPAHLRGSGGEKRRRVAARVFRIPVRHTAAPWTPACGGPWQARAVREPDAAVLDELYRHELLWRTKVGA
jgi:hypothetical protein